MKQNPLVQFSIKHPLFTLWSLFLLCLGLSLFIFNVQVDTDPENMLAEEEAVRVFHNRIKKEFTLHDVIVLGVVNETNPNGVFNPKTLNKIHSLTNFALSLKSADDPEKYVISKDLIALGTTETIEQAGLGQVSFDWLMKEAPQTQKDALRIRDKAMANPLLKGTLISEDGKAAAIYIPVSSKDFAAEVREHLLEHIDSLKEQHSNDKFYITGLPVAEDTFGKEMFVQMAISAPLAMLVIFLLMLFFFKKVRLIIAPMIVAIFAVMATMGLFVSGGNTLHIMSSMIPIFLMPIAVVDSIHILSEFFDLYPIIQDRRKTLEQVMGHLFMPMFYTSLTSAAGFASLTMTPIPPVQSFGLYVALGILIAWLFTILVTPAYVMLMPEKSFHSFKQDNSQEKRSQSKLSRFLEKTGQATYSNAKFIILFSFIGLLIAGYGISKIQINDNPVHWFTPKHPIRVADNVLNSHFGGTYEAFLVLEGKKTPLSPQQAAEKVRESLTSLSKEFEPPASVLKNALALVNTTVKNTTSENAFIEQLSSKMEAQLDTVSDENYEIWTEFSAAIDQFRNRDQIFKRPDVLRYISSLQQELLNTGVIGKSNSISDVVKKIHQELFEANPDKYRIPDSIGAVAQCLISFQNSHKPDDLWHLVTPDYKATNIWVQLKKGDNQVMEQVVEKVNQYMLKNPPPAVLEHNWAGLTYLNVEWQDMMVSGMRDSFLGSFVIVFLMMAILFRSPLWGFLAMVPLSVTIILIYGFIGLIGKDYDMPVAVLSSLALGLAVDFAIHFLERTKSTYAQKGTWKETVKTMFEEPARAISRNVIVIAVGFMPLLAAPLIPYQTVGVLLASIMAISGIATILILPALITLIERTLFKGR